MEFYSSEIFNYIINNKKKILEIQHNKEEKNYNIIDEKENSIEGE